MRYGTDTRKQATELVDALERAKALKTVNFGDFLEMVRYAKALHSIAVHDCNGTMTARMETQRANTEAKVLALTSKHGLKVDFTGDPRGFVVKIHAPKGNVYNTWGGAETGYGIG